MPGLLSNRGGWRPAKHTLGFSMVPRANYLVGKFDGITFTPETKPQALQTGMPGNGVATYSDVRRRWAPHSIPWGRNSGLHRGMPFNQ